MRMVIRVSFPHQPFNAAVRDGSAEAKIGRILQEVKPEAAYFTEIDGQRCAILVVDVEDPSEIPRFAEPWFLAFEADVRFRPVMTPEDLTRAGLDALGKTWA